MGLEYPRLFKSLWLTICACGLCYFGHRFGILTPLIGPQVSLELLMLFSLTKWEPFPRLECHWPSEPETTFSGQAAIGYASLPYLDLFWPGYHLF